MLTFIKKKKSIVLVMGFLHSNKTISKKRIPKILPLNKVELIMKKSFKNKKKLEFCAGYSNLDNLESSSPCQPRLFLENTHIHRALCWTCSYLQSSHKQHRKARTMQRTRSGTHACPLDAERNRQTLQRSPWDKWNPAIWNHLAPAL